MITEDAIRDALHRVADIAPDGARVRAGLAGRARRYRQRRTLLVAGGVTAAAAAVAGPAVLVVRNRPVDIHAGTPNVAEPAAPPAPAGGNGFVPLRWRPTWLPEGYVELSRTVTVEGPDPGLQIRSWRLRDGGEEDYIHLHAGPPEWFGDQSWRRPARVNGAPGGVAREPGQVSQVVWRPTPEETLAVGITSLAADNLALAQRIAGSVVADGVAGCEVPVALGWLPDGVATAAGEQRLTIATDQRGDVQVELQQLAERSSLPVVLVMIGYSVPRPGGWEAVTVRGRRGVARVTPAPDREPIAARPEPMSGPSGWVHVELDDRRQLYVDLQFGGVPDPPALALAELLEVADSLQVGPEPDTGWLGQR